MLSNLMELCSM